MKIYGVNEKVSTEEYGYTGGMVNLEYDTIISYHVSKDEALAEVLRLNLKRHMCSEFSLIEISVND